MTSEAEIAVAEYVARLCPGVEHWTDWGPFRALGIASADVLVAGVVFSQMNGFDALVSIGSTSPRWATKRRIRAILTFAFDDLKLVRLTAMTSIKNTRARQFLKRLGFREEGKKLKGFDGQTHMMIYGLTRRDAARWL